MLKTVSFSALHIGLIGSGSFRYGVALTVLSEPPNVQQKAKEIIPDINQHWEINADGFVADAALSVLQKRKKRRGRVRGTREVIYYVTTGCGSLCASSRAPLSTRIFFSSF